MRKSYWDMTMTELDKFFKHVGKLSPQCIAEELPNNNASSEEVHIMLPRKVNLDVSGNSIKKSRENTEKVVERSFERKFADIGTSTDSLNKSEPAANKSLPSSSSEQPNDWKKSLPSQHYEWSKKLPPTLLAPNYTVPQAQPPSPLTYTQ